MMKKHHLNKWLKYFHPRSWTIRCITLRGYKNLWTIRSISSWKSTMTVWWEYSKRCIKLWQTKIKLIKKRPWYPKKTTRVRLVQTNNNHTMKKMRKHRIHIYWVYLKTYSRHMSWRWSRISTMIIDNFSLRRPIRQLRRAWWLTIGEV
jgi:hypothetical protein